MTFVPAPNIAMVEMRAVVANQKVENRIMVDCLAPPNPVVLSDLATIAATWWGSDYADFVHTTVQLTEVVATDMGNLNGSQFVFTPGTTITGGQGGDPMPNEVSYCASLRTASRGRSARGRFYTLPMARTSVVVNNFTEAYVTGITTALNLLRGTIEGAGYLPVIVSYVSNKVPRPGGPVYFPITNVTSVDSIVDSMRRRKPGVGE